MEQSVFDAFDRLFNARTKQSPTEKDVDMVREQLYDDACMQELEKRNAALRRAVSDFTDDPIVFIECVSNNAEQKRFLRSLAELDAPPATNKEPIMPPAPQLSYPPERPVTLASAATPKPAAVVVSPATQATAVITAPSTFQTIAPAATPLTPTNTKRFHWSEFDTKPKTVTPYANAILLNPDWQRFRVIVENIARAMREGNASDRFRAKEKWDAWYETTWCWTRGESGLARIPLGDYLRQCMNDLQKGLDPESETYKIHYVGT